MSSRRRSTVHDLAALRLHPDGSRVHNSQKNLRLRTAKYSVRDTRGNWIAQDAGGLGNVKQRRSARKEQDAEEGESFDLSGGERHASQSVKVMDEDLEENTRARKRRRFHEDLGFLEAHPSGPSSRTVGDPSGTNNSPVDPRTPSSDLLKCLHHFSSAYYGAMGQLYDASKEARRAKRLRRLKRLQQQAGDAADDEQRKSEGTESPAHDEDSESLTEDEDSSKDETEEAEKAKRRERHWTAKASKTDMYKLFDGSALMALGMLVQEHIEGLLAPDIPAGWEAAIAAQEEVEPAKDRKPRQHKKRTHKGKEAASTIIEGDDRETTDCDAAVEDEHRDRRATRGVGLSGPLPFVDDDSGDEDFVP